MHSILSHLPQVTIGVLGCTTPNSTQPSPTAKLSLALGYHSLKHSASHMSWRDDTNATQRTTRLVDTQWVLLY